MSTQALMDVAGDSSNVSGTSSSNEARQQSIDRCLQGLYHVCQCRDVNCRLPMCIKMKRVMQHAKSCKKKRVQSDDTDRCPICKQFISLCCFHAKHCAEANCPMPYCEIVKQKIKNSQGQERLQHQFASLSINMSQSQDCQSSSSNSAPFYPQNNQSFVEAAAVAAPLQSSNENLDHSVEPEELELEVLNDLLENLELN